MPIYPWKTRNPSNAHRIDEPVDVFITLDKWPQQAFEYHYHDAFNWLMPIRSGWIGVEIDDKIHTITETHWIVIFPNVSHRITDKSKEVDVLSLFIAHEPMFEAWKELDNRPTDDFDYFFGGKTPIAQGLALQLCELKTDNQIIQLYKDAFITYLSRWLWSCYLNSNIKNNDAQGLLSGVSDPKSLVIQQGLEEFVAEGKFPWEIICNRLGMSMRSFQR